MNGKTKKVTLKSLAEKMEAGFNSIETKMMAGFEKVDKDIESLALMTAESFATMTTDIQTLKQSATNLEQGQENIWLRLDSLAPKFEVQALTKRVEHLEDKAGIHYAV